MKSTMDTFKNMSFLKYLTCLICIERCWLACLFLAHWKQLYNCFSGSQTLRHIVLFSYENNTISLRKPNAVISNPATDRTNHILLFCFGDVMHLFGFMRPNLNNKFALVIGNVCLQSIKKILILFFRSCMLTTIYVNNTFNILKRDFLN